MATLQENLGAPRLVIKFLSSNAELLTRAVNELVEVIDNNGIARKGPIPLPTDREVFTVGRSPHLDGRSREKFQKSRHKKILILLNATQATMEQIKSLNLSSGIGLEIKYYPGKTSNNG